MKPSRPLAALVAVTAALSALLSAAPAQAAPPTERTLTDAVDAGASYDILSTTLRAAPAPGKQAKVVIKHDRRAESGDGLDLWFDLDGDRVPDVYLTGMAYSEYAVFKTSSFGRHGREISDLGCFGLKINQRKAVVKFRPDCLGESTSYAVAVRSYRHGEPPAGADWAPGRERVSKKVASYAASA
jgi:hypothetical protein